MINGKYFAKRTIAHLNPILDALGTKQYEKRFKRTSENSINLDGIHFNFNTNKNHLEIMIEKEDLKDFEEKIKSIRTKEFWQQKSLMYLKKKRKKYETYLKKLNVKSNGSGNIYFNADLNTKNEDKAFFAVLNCIIRPVLYGLSKD